MKRFLALFAVVAIIGSMFAGVAMAAVGDKIELNNDQVVKGAGYATVTGRLLDAVGAYTQAYDGEDVVVVYAASSQKMATVDGYKFEVMVDRTEVGSYKIIIDMDKDLALTAGDLEVGIDVIYDVTLDDDLEFDFPVDDFVVISGNAVDAEKEAVELKYANTAAFATATTNDDGDFVMAFNGEFVMDHAGDIELWIDGVKHVEGEIIAEPVTVELSNSEFPVGLLDQAIEITLDGVGDYDNAGGTAFKTYTYNITVTDEDDDTVVYPLLSTVGETKIDEYTPVKWNTLGSFNALLKGTYTVTIEVFNGAKLVMEGSADFDVVSDSGYVLTGWHNFDEIKVVPTPIVLGTTLTAYKDGVPYTYYAVTYEGAGLDETTEHNLNAGGVNLPNALDADDLVTVADTVTISPTHAGTIDVTIDVYEVNGKEYDLIKTYEKEMVVEGYSIEVNLEEVLVGEEYELTVVVTDEDGNPVNNALVYIGQGFVTNGVPALTDAFEDPTDNNIISGTYSDDEWEHDTVEELDIVVKDGTTLMASLKEAIDVVGEAVFNVDADIDTLLRGNEEVITLTVTDENGDSYFPVKNDVNMVEDAVVMSIGDKVDLDDDDVKESFEVTIRVEEDADETVRVRVTDDSGKDQGEFEFNVVAPEIVLTSDAVLTENFEAELSFTIVDPRDNSVIEEPHDVVFDIENVDCDNTGAFDVLWYDKDEDHDAALDGQTTVNPTEAEEYTYYIETSGIDWDEAEDDEVTPELVISVELFNAGAGVTTYVVEAAAIPFGEATLASTPETMVMGTNNILTLTYTDANGNVLEGYDIELDGDEIGETDENGQVVYSAASVSTTGLTFEADTDGSAKVDVKVKSTLDMNAPVITAPAEVAVPQVTVTVTDDVRVSAVRINGTFLSIFPLATVSETVALEEGVNTIQVEAMDINNNATMQVLTVTYAKPVAPTADVELTVGEATEFGTPELTSGTTMVPVRFATKLGASMAWDNATKTVTYTLGETVISMTNGSTTAIVNGENVELTQAPFINGQNFTMVPLRMIAQELGFQVVWTSNSAPIQIVK